MRFAILIKSDWIIVLLVPTLIIACFLMALYIKDQNKRL